MLFLFHIDYTIYPKQQCLTKYTELIIQYRVILDTFGSDSIFVKNVTVVQWYINNKSNTVSFLLCV